MDRGACSSIDARRFKLTIIEGKKHHLRLQSPWKIFGPVEKGEVLFDDRLEAEMPAYYLTNSTAGILAGDLLEGSIRLQENTKAKVLAPSATRVFTMPAGTASQSLTVSLAADSMLLYSAHQLIPYRSARFIQDNDYRLEKGASLAVLEVFVPGRIAGGESFAFQDIRQRTRIFLEDRLVLDDRWVVKDLAPQGCFVSFRTRVVGTLYVAGPLVESLLMERLVDTDPMMGFTRPHPHLLIGRALAVNAQSAENRLKSAFQRMMGRNEQSEFLNTEQ